MKQKILKISALVSIAVGLLLVFIPNIFWFAYCPDDIALRITQNDGYPRWFSYERALAINTMVILTAVGAAIAFVGMVLFVVSQLKKFKKSDGIAFGFISLALLSVILLLTALTPCVEWMPSARPMACVWMWRMIIGICAGISALGLLMLVKRESKEALTGIGYGMIVLAVLFTLVPRTLLSGCNPANDMLCLDGFETFGLVMGIVLTVIAAANVALLHFNKKQEETDEE